jgi:heme-degrading monooxygenase HmoA
MRVIVSIVRFKSGLTDDDVQALFEERADQYREVPGLVEKLYLRYRDTGEFGAVYVWESDDDLRAFRATELARTIADAYQVEGETRSELADVRLTVAPNAQPSAASK